MARRARVVLPGYPHHVTQRGIRRSEIFRDDNDKNIYKKIMRKHFIEFGVQIIAYCLMDNHVHFVCIPPFAESLALSIGQGHSTYSRYFNAKEGYVGHLFQNRFYSCAMSNDHAQACLRYVERNPVSAGLVSKAEDYRWSSAAAHCGFTEDHFLTQLADTIIGSDQWSKFLQDDPGFSEIKQFKKNTQSGRPIGSEEFLEYAKVESGVDFAAKPRGRKKRRVSFFNQGSDETR